MHVSKLDINGNGLVGLYILPLNDLVFVGRDVPEEEYSLIEDVFGGKIVSLTIAGTSLLGVFLATDGEKLLVPDILFSHEKEILDASGVEYTLIKTKQTCLGNNVVFTQKGAILNPTFEKSAIDEITNFLSVPIHLADNEFPTIGSFLAHNSSHGLVSHDFSDAKISEIEKQLGLTILTGTVNLGSTQVASGIAVNNKGFLIGTISGGPEIMNADHALGFIDN